METFPVLQQNFVRKVNNDYILNQAAKDSCYDQKKKKKEEKKKKKETKETKGKDNFFSSPFPPPCLHNPHTLTMCVCCVC